MSAFFSGRRDDSTFLSDGFFDTSMLLPNQDLAPGYQKVDLSAAYQVHRRLRGYLVIENLFDQEYQPSFGFPGLPLTARAGVRVTFGGAPAVESGVRRGYGSHPLRTASVLVAASLSVPLRPSPGHSARSVPSSAGAYKRRLPRRTPASSFVRHPGWQRRDLRPRR